MIEYSWYENMVKYFEEARIQARICNDLIEQIAQLIHSDLPQKQFADICYEFCTHFLDRPNITLSALCMGLVFRQGTKLTRDFTRHLAERTQAERERMAKEQ